MHVRPPEVRLWTACIHSDSDHEDLRRYSGKVPRNRTALAREAALSTVCASTDLVNKTKARQ
jgi:hypothetical protein